MTGIDWQRAHEALEHVRRRLDEDQAPSGPAARRILEMRAQLLAQPLAEPAAAGETLELLVFSRAGETYAVEAASVVEVVPLHDPTSVPSVPPAVLGVVNCRGRIIPVVDLARLLPTASGDSRECSFAVIAVSGGACFGIGADAVSGMAEVEEEEVWSGEELGDDRRDSVVRGLTAAMVAILDVQALACDPRVEVDDEVE